MQRFGPYDHPDITYPAEWTYSLVGHDEAAIRDTVKQVLGARLYRLSVSRRSSGGKYISMALELVVETEAERTRLYAEFGASNAIVTVL